MCLQPGYDRQGEHARAVMFSRTNIFKLTSADKSETTENYIVVIGQRGQLGPLGLWHMFVQI